MHRRELAKRGAKVGRFIVEVDECATAPGLEPDINEAQILLVQRFGVEQCRLDDAGALAMDRIMPAVERAMEAARGIAATGTQPDAAMAAGVLVGLYGFVVDPHN